MARFILERSLVFGRFAVRKKGAPDNRIKPHLGRRFATKTSGEYETIS